MTEQQRPIREAALDVGALLIVLGGVALIGVGVEHAFGV